jgi:hypothetical protein
MGTAYRIIDRIQDMADFSGPLTANQFIQWDGTGFVLAEVVQVWEDVDGGIAPANAGTIYGSQAVGGDMVLKSNPAGDGHIIAENQIRGLQATGLGLSNYDGTTGVSLGNGSVNINTIAGAIIWKFEGLDFYPTDPSNRRFGNPANPIGQAYFGGYASGVPINVGLAASQTANGIEQRTSGGVTNFAVGPSGIATSGGTDNYARLDGSGSSGARVRLKSQLGSETYILAENDTSIAIGYANSKVWFDGRNNPVVMSVGNSVSIYDSEIHSTNKLTLVPGSGSGVVAVRQPGGVAGTDEVQISHSGDRAELTSKQGDIAAIVPTSSDAFRVFDAAGNRRAVVASGFQVGDFNTFVVGNVPGSSSYTHSYMWLDLAALWHQSGNFSLDESSVGFSRYANSTLLLRDGAGSAADLMLRAIYGKHASGANAQASNCTIAPGQSTGNATPASVILQSTVAGSSGSTAQGLFDYLTIGNGETTWRTSTGTTYGSFTASGDNGGEFRLSNLNVVGHTMDWLDIQTPRYYLQADGGKFAGLGAGTVGSFFAFNSSGFFAIEAVSAVSSIGSGSPYYQKIFGSTGNTIIGTTNYITADPGVQLTVLANSASTIGSVIRAAASATADVWQGQASDGTTIYGTMSENGYWTTRKNAAPADAELAAGEAAWWLDADNATPKFMVKAKTADGTVVTGSLALA